MAFDRTLTHFTKLYIMARSLPDGHAPARSADDGQKSSSEQSPHAGLLAKQTRRP